MVKEGFRKFLGLEIELKNPHDINHPVLIDATVFQNDGAHFVSLFPWSDTHLLIVDNYYSNTPFLHAEKLRKDILNSVEKRGWVLKSIEREEYGVRAIPLEGALGSWSEGVVLSGARGGFFHATTGDSFAYAARFADAVAHMKTFEARKVFAAVQSWARKHWRDQSFYRRFNRKIFQAENGQRCRIFQELYAQPQARIARFYQGRLSWWDKLWFSYPPTPSSSDTTSSR
jgi:lycopene beta-cyclase